MKLITKKLITDLIKKADESPRRRNNLNFHKDFSDLVQRMLVATKYDTYFRPHRHNDKSEFALVIKGCFEVFIFDDSGIVIQRITVGCDTDVKGFEIDAGTWHTWLPLENDSVFFEVKQGPYEPKTASEFAAWAPEEGSDKVFSFIELLKKSKAGDNVNVYKRI